MFNKSFFFLLVIGIISSCSKKDTNINEVEVWQELLPTFCAQLEIEQINFKYPQYKGDSNHYNFQLKNWFSILDSVSKQNPDVILGIYDSLDYLDWYPAFVDEFSDNKYAEILNQIQTYQKKTLFLKTEELNAISGYELIPIISYVDSLQNSQGLYNRLYGGTLSFSRIYFNTDNNLGIARADYILPNKIYGLLLEIEFINGKWSIIQNKVVWQSDSESSYSTRS